MKTASLVALAWCRFQPRTLVLADRLGGHAEFVTAERGPKWARRLFTRYLRCALATWQLLERCNPAVVLVITPPVFAPLVAWAWCAVRRRHFVVDCHTDTFHARKWAWARPLHRLLFGAATAVLVHTEEAEALLRSWQAPVLLLPDDVPEVSQAARLPRGSRPRVVVAGGLDEQEPVREAIQAAALVPQIEFRFTGDEQRIPAADRAAAPDNVVFTGYLAYPIFLGELQAADVVAAFSTDPHIMNRAAFEAVGLGCALVLSDLPGLRSRFGMVAQFCANVPESMAAAVAQAMEERASLAERSVHAQQRLRAQHEDALARLQAILGPFIAAHADRRLAAA